jgi:hypothetical protein
MNTADVILFTQSVAKYTNATSEELAELVRLTRELHVVNERLSVEDDNIEPLIKKQRRIENRIEELAGKIGAISVTFIFSNYPRYVAVKLYFEGMTDYEDGISIPHQ